MRLGDVASVNPRTASKPHPDEVVSFVPMADLDATNARTTSGTDRAFGDVATGFRIFRDGDILLAKITPSFENNKIGQAQLARPVGVGSTEFHVIRPLDTLCDARYLLHFLRQDWIRLEGERKMTGSGGQRRVPQKFLERLPLPLPPLDEQRRIAAILDRASELRQVVDRALDRLDVIEDAAFIKTFGSPRTWSARWHMGTIGDLATSVQYGTSAKAGASGEYKMLRMGNITMRGRLDLTDLKYIDLPADEVTKFTTRRGDLLFNRTNSFEQVGKTGLVDTDEPMAIAGYLVRLRLHESLAPEFVGAYLNSTYGRNLRQNRAKLAVNQANINATQLKQLPIAVPPHGIQQEFQHIVRAIDDQRRSWHKTRQTLDTLTVSLQSRAFRGEL